MQPCRKLKLDDSDDTVSLIPNSPAPLLKIPKSRNELKELWADKEMRNNLIGSCMTQSISAFTYYFISYYTKYWASAEHHNTDFFVLFGMLGLADGLSMAFIQT